MNKYYQSKCKCDNSKESNTGCTDQYQCVHSLLPIERVCTYLVKRGCSHWSRTMMISPGSSPGSWSPSPWKTIFWPSFIPLSMWTSKIFFCRKILRPAHALQRSLWLIFCPWPWQLWHTVDTCWTIPGSSWCTLTCMPVPWQDIHTCPAPFRLPRPKKVERHSEHTDYTWYLCEYLGQDYYINKTVAVGTWLKSPVWIIRQDKCCTDIQSTAHITYLHICHKQYSSGQTAFV